MALVVTCMSHGLANCVRWFGCVHALLVRGTWQGVASEAGCRLVRRHGVRWRSGCVTVRYSSRGDTNSVFVCALLHVHAVALATGNCNWGALGAESVANLLHHAPVLQTVVLSGTAACTHRCHLFGLHTHLPCAMPVGNADFASEGCDLGEAGWRVILHALATAPHTPKEVVGLEDDFVHSTDFDPAAVLRDLKWPVDVLQQPNPVTAILQFCRELHKGAHSGDPVASLLLLGPGGAGKSTLLHRLTKDEFNAAIKSTDGLRIGAWLKTGVWCDMWHGARRMHTTVVSHTL